MNKYAGYFSGLLTFLPLLFVQIQLARWAVRSWPRWRGLFIALVAFPAAVSVLSVPFLHGMFTPPGWLYVTMNTWLYTSFVSFVVFQAIDFPVGLIARRNPIDPSRRAILRKAAYTVAAVPAAAVMYGSFIERTDFSVADQIVKIPNLPAELEGLRILQISDVHRSAFLSRKELERLVDMARGIRSDLILHTGDFISGRGDPLEECIRNLAQLKSTAGAFGCLGNHEAYADAEEETVEIGAANGIKILRSSSQVLQFGNAKLNLVGVDYQPFYTRAHYLEGVQSLVVPGACNILLSHNPDVFPVAARMGFDLTFSGHTHGGQVRMEILNRDVDFARFYTPFVSGAYQAGGKSLYVTRGVGTVGIPSRVGAPPEISLIRLSRA